MIKGFPRESEAAYVENVDVSGCSLTDDSGLLNLTSLRKLNISNNQLSTISSLRTGQLSLLNASKNQLECIPRGLTYLATLNLGHNAHLKLGKRAVSELTRLRALILNDCNIVNVRVLARLTQLSTLVLSSNAITDVVPLMPLLKNNLTKLSLSRNAINVLPPLQMPALRELRVAHNALMCVPPMDMPQLRLCDFGHNLIKRLDWLLPRVRHLNLRGNPMADKEDYVQAVSAALSSKLDVFDGRRAPTFPSVAKLPAGDPSKAPTPVPLVTRASSDDQPQEQQHEGDARKRDDGEKQKKSRKKRKKKKKKKETSSKRKAPVPAAEESNIAADEKESFSGKRVKQTKEQEEQEGEEKGADAETGLKLVIHDPLLSAQGW